MVIIAIPLVREGDQLSDPNSAVSLDGEHRIANLADVLMTRS